MGAESVGFSEIWREACRNQPLVEQASVIGELLAQRLPVAALLFRRLNREQSTIETVAAWGIRPGYVNHPAVSHLSTEGLNAWLDACQKRAAQRLDLDRSHESMLAVAPTGLQDGAVVVPLYQGDSWVGVAVLVPPTKSPFDQAAVQLATSLIDPLSIALENDQRLHELTTMRQAAEADRRSLLTRLGRQEMSETVVGADSGLRLVMERVELVSPSDVPILILGETGTGKEVIARAIHNRSPRHAGPFIRVNCGAIPSELVDSQLFGHEKGSFTGASDQRQGWFERADGGTLFLDEMGELPLPAQVRLLRVLQEHQIERVGGQKLIHVDVRIVAATHRDLATMVKAGTFREDLWYRINIFPILLPRLRERVEDIPDLVRHFVQRAAHRFQLPLVEASSADMAMLMNYGWPGNIRELGAVIDRAVILGNGKTLAIAAALGLSQPVTALPDDSEPTFYEVIPESLPRSAPAAPVIDESPILPLDQAMKLHIERALVATEGRIEGKDGAAALLQINPHTLRARMRKHGLDWSRYRRR